MRSYEIGGLDIRGCIACGGCSDGMCVFADEAFCTWTHTLEEADGILLACPVYYAGIPGTMKAFQTASSINPAAVFA
ncbi:MAG: flavodoxin family protein [Clostridia bacterium]